MVNKEVKSSLTYISYFLAVWFVSEVIVAPAYGQATANIFAWNAFLVLFIFLIIEKTWLYLYRKLVNKNRLNS